MVDILRVIRVDLIPESSCIPGNPVDSCTVLWQIKRCAEEVSPLDGVSHSVATSRGCGNSRIADSRLCELGHEDVDDRSIHVVVHICDCWEREV